ncbi:ribosomal RNA small subunit methyltransferase I [Halobacillus andaensis]|uniref:Ribosomal RNA small subunit methyltransferase I n=1 Tax=Halobacillus andaensis TaxID=1176239 RepID=A0A917EZ38_HALAA|nr:16S rRNA (cytidine(1402)-2'-O)-methyltransferase [Halobacillus andaensis]MBP2006690.1 16S rRNA (cytidine1402-2'-O)-methyltransferase [Halobacillus andaensis]GGF35881.1 ribosomal RNA small subunit methyltransferase I [Halobacillus andaensis]
MNIQKSYTNHEGKGTLYIVPTPIGNLDDMTYRAVSVLHEAKAIAAEDTRNTKKLLHYFEITTPLISYHEHNKQTRGPQLISRLQEGDDLAVVSDAGMPGISDPGADLVRMATEENIPVVVLPGANAALPALVGSGLSTDQFLFCGFLPRKKKERLAVLESLQNHQATLIFYESPHRLKEMLQHVHQQFGNRRAALVRELTKKYEEYVRGTLEELIQWSVKEEIRGEFCVIVEGTDEVEEEDAFWWTHLSITEHVDYYVKENDLKSKEAIKQTAVDRKMQKREVYQAYHVHD